MEVLVVLFVLLFILLVITLIGHGIWVVLRWIIRQLAGTTAAERQVQELGLSRCGQCSAAMSLNEMFCARCGARKPVGVVVELLKDLAATERQVERFRRSGVITGDAYEDFKHKIHSERTRLSQREAASPATPASVPLTPPSTATSPTTQTQPASVTAAAVDETTFPFPLPPPSVVVVTESSTSSSVIIDLKDDAIINAPGRAFAHEEIAAPSFASQAASTPPATASAKARRPFTEVLAAFMEQSNIRWGEIIGGLLIIGCSTALVVSLWAQISQIPVLKFLIFTTVTAALFGVGMYTEHRWKLPTTSRGILTIATLLVPLNFLAIAAVSGGAVPPGALVIGSELIAPALFLCLVYFAGRVITPLWPHLLAAGVLGSSVGQLLIRHFAMPDNSPALLLALGAFPVVCYVGAAAWMLWIALADGEIDEGETVGIVTTLGALTFAALLPFGLLVYKSGPVSMTMMYLAPMITLGGVPMLASGTLLWQRVTRKELAAYRTAGTSMAILATMMVLSGMVLAWPNPASIVPAALFSFSVFTALAVWLELPPAHLVAAGCVALAYLVLFHVSAGHVDWQNLRVTSLVEVMDQVSTGQALAAPFVGFLIVAEWLRSKQRQSDSSSYVVAACITAAVSLVLITRYGFGVPGDPHHVWLLYVLYAVGVTWIGWRLSIAAVTLIGAGLLLVGVGQGLGPWLQISFPWQAALLVHASVCAVAAIVFSRHERTRNALSSPLNAAGLTTSFLVVGSVLFSGLVLLDLDSEWQPTPMLAQRLFWLAGIWLVLLWLNRSRALLTAFQICLTLALVLAIKSLLQQYDWYAYLPHASLHPWSLQIQGTVLLLLSLVWVAARFVFSDESKPGAHSVDATPDASWLRDARRLLNARVSFDRIVPWIVLGGFVLLAIYGASAGVLKELTARGSESPVWDIAGFPHQYALGPGSWIVLGLLVIALCANLWQRRRAVYLPGAVVALATVCPLLAGRWEAQLATASAWRWLAALFFVVASVPLWFRQRLSPTNFSLSWLGEETGTNDQRQTEVCRTIAQQTRVLLLAATLIPLLVLTAYPALRAIYYMPVRGPSGGIFYALDETLSYSIPLVIAALALIVYALRERSVIYAFCAGLFFNLTVTIAYLLSVVSIHGNMDRVVLVQVVQLNAITAALYAILWLSVRERWLPRLSEVSAALAEKLFKVQLGITVAGIASILVFVAIHLLARPGWAGPGTGAAGGLYGWIAFALATLALAGCRQAYAKPLSPDSLCAVLAALSCLVAFTTARWSPVAWSGYHALMSTLAVTAWLMWFARGLPSFLEQAASGSSLLKQIPANGFTTEWSSNTALYAAAAAAVTVFIALRGVSIDPSGAWWSIGALVAMSALSAALHWQTLTRGYLYAAGILLQLAVTVWWFTPPAHSSSATEFIEASIIALCGPSIIWLWFELRARRLSEAANKNTALSFHNLAVLCSLTLVGSIVWLRLVESAFGVPLSHSDLLGWLALGSVVALMGACLWDQNAKYAVAGLYLLGLVSLGMALAGMDLVPHHLSWAAMMALAVYAITTSLLWRWHQQLIGWATQLGIPRRLDPEATGLTWLVAFSAAIIAVLVCFAYSIDLQFPEWPLRVTAALAVGAQALTCTLMAPAKQRQRWQRVAFALFTLGAVLFGWAWLVPAVSGTWLNRALILMVEMFAMVALLGLELDKALEREPEWTRAIRDCAPWLTATGSVALIFVLCTEVFYQIEFGAVRINPLALIITGITLASASIICVLFALSPRHDPLSLPEHRRRNYVYVAELMMALLFMHIRLTMPWLFTGFFERYWPVVVVGIAYLGVVTSELLRRRGVLVLAHPVERTGVFLPLLPVFGFWLTEPQVDYSVLLFIVGGLYGLLSILRKSFMFGILAVLAGNGGLWYLWHRTDEYGLLQHPQLWLIPAACSVLVAAWLNRKDFSEEQMIGIRYLALVTIYASSTADIFINGVARSPWLPMILAALSLGGVFGGIVLRIRAFLMLGAIFLLLAITTMIYYASVNFGWTWLWYVAGIVTGAVIIFIFALFEKKRDEMLRVVEGLKEWQQ